MYMLKTDENIKLLDIICTVYPTTGSSFVYIVDRISDMVYHVGRGEAERIFNEILNGVSPDFADFLLTANESEIQMAVLRDIDLTDSKRVVGRKGIKPSHFLSS